ncbi:MAG: class I SAM-dependent methyltransferase, partial [Acidimicrobiales bacterium]|nr:class I SAM-dependent methyltransferase [Acidimicrobiales bacterium]
MVLRRALDRLNPGTLIVTPYPLGSESTYGWTQPPHGELTDLLAAGEDDYRRVLSGAEKVLDDLRTIARTSDTADAATHAPWWENSYFSSLDAVVLYSEIVQRSPATYFEVGSGHSTRFVAHAIRTHGLDTRIVSVDPSPRAEVDALCDEFHRSPFEAFDLDTVRLEAGDVVLIDGSHVATMGSDVIRAFLEFLPTVPPGVLVGIDDIFLPWDYP